MPEPGEPPHSPGMPDLSSNPMNFSALLLKAANGLFSLIVGLALVVAGTYSVYALWDNEQIYAAADNVQADMIRLKPKLEPAENEEEARASFAELLAINKDVRAWVTVDNTNVDFPVLQGEDNLTYINTDIYGNFALAGSILLDSRNAPDCSDAYSLLYGHHLANSGMFGDLDLIKDEKFFAENRTGALILPDRAYSLEIYACLLVSASEEAIFEPETVRGDMHILYDFCTENAMFCRTETLEAARNDPASQTLALSTCSSEFTDARTIVLALMKPYQPDTTGG